jgi:hypothetical protein
MDQIDLLFLGIQDANQFVEHPLLKHAGRELLELRRLPFKILSPGPDDVGTVLFLGQLGE